MANDVYTMLGDLPEEYQSVHRGFQILSDLQSLPRSSDLLLFGLFTIVESLLTHSPNSKEVGDSITHQIKTKIPLLEKRLMRPLRYQEHFPNLREEKVWTKLYSFRSQIAHGENAEFSRELKGLQDRETIYAFINDAVKLLLIQGLREPDLIRDLKKC